MRSSATPSPATRPLDRSRSTQLVERVRLSALGVIAAATFGAAPPPSGLDPRPSVDSASGVAALSAPKVGMVRLPAGTFTIGIGMDELERAVALCRSEPLGDHCKEYPFAYALWAHSVHLRAFLLDRTEVTVGAYRRCVAAGACTRPTYAEGDPRFDRDELPVSHVSWDDARDYCVFRGARLPTEAEWERAARGEDPDPALCKAGKSAGGCAPRRFPWGALPNPKLANHGALDLGSVFLPSGEFLQGIADPTDGALELAPVGRYPDGATPQGIQDLAGNVAEWVEDLWSDQFPNVTVTDPHGPSTGTLRVVRGGSYRSPLAMIRASARDRRPPSTRDATIGFRCARDAPS
jgi:formylglycine-generating enzyme required for sulfatase activity